VSAFLSALVRRPPAPAAERIQTAAEIIPDAPALAPELPFTAAQQAGVENRCPVCQARFRGARVCSRCGADLEPLMVLAVKAWQLREASRAALVAGNVDRSLALAVEAQGVHHTDSGAALRLLTSWWKQTA
jgi:hypothetical protein